MYDILKQDSEPLQSSDWSRNKVGQISLFRTGSTLSTAREQQKLDVKTTKSDNMKGAVVLGFGDSVRAENLKRDNKEEVPQKKVIKKDIIGAIGVPKAPQLNMEDIMRSLDFKINNFEKLNKKVEQLNEISQKGKNRLQECQGDDISIVC